MANDKPIAGQNVVQRVNVHEPDDIRAWAKRLGVDEDQLKETIKGVGTSIDAIKKALTVKAVRPDRQ